MWLDGPRKGKADKNGKRPDLPTMRQRLFLAGEDVEEADVPAGGEFVWRSFWELHRRRGNNGYGPNMLTWPEVRAWNETMRCGLSPWEARAIMEMDEAYFAARDELDEDKPKPGAAPDAGEIMNAFAAALGVKK